MRFAGWRVNLDRALDRADDLRSQLARAVEREVTAQAQLQQQLATLSGALAQLTGSRQPGLTTCRNSRW